MDSKLEIVRKHQQEQQAKQVQEKGEGAYLYLMRNGSIEEWAFQPWKEYAAYLSKRMAEYQKYAARMGTESLQILKCSSPKGQLPFNPEPENFNQVEVLESWNKEQ